MSERLTEIEQRIGSVRALSSVVAAIRSIAAARLRESEEKVEGVRAYARNVGQAISQATSLAPQSGREPVQLAPSGNTLVIALCSEQGFVGSYNSRVLDAAAQLVRSEKDSLLLVGSRGQVAAGERGLPVEWSTTMAGHVEETIDLANRLADVLYRKFILGVDSVTIVHALPTQTVGQSITRKMLVPFDYSQFPAAASHDPPMVNLPPDILLTQLAEEYVFAELCEAAMLSLAAENQARIQAMIAAHQNLNERLDQITATARRIRQEEITSEVVELAAAVDASR